MKLKVARMGAGVTPWMVLCPKCPPPSRHVDTDNGQRGINTFIGWKGHTSAMRAADRHVRWHVNGRPR